MLHLATTLRTTGQQHRHLAGWHVGRGEMLMVGSEEKLKIRKGVSERESEVEMEL